MADIELKELLREYHMDIQMYLKDIYYLEKREFDFENDIKDFISRFSGWNKSYLKSISLKIKDDSKNNCILVETVFYDTSYNNQTTKLEYRLTKKYYKHELKCGFIYES